MAASAMSMRRWAALYLRGALICRILAVSLPRSDVGRARVRSCAIQQISPNRFL
jgi:hypothetical protein